MNNYQITEILQTIEIIIDDTSIPKNARQKLSEISIMLKQGKDVSLCVSRALGDLDELQEDINLQAFTRTQIFNVASMLEKV